MIVIWDLIGARISYDSDKYSCEISGTLASVIKEILVNAYDFRGHRFNPSFTSILQLNFVINGVLKQFNPEIIQGSELLFESVEGSIPENALD